MLKAHQLVLIFLGAAIGTLVASAFFTTVQCLCFGLISGVFTYSFLLSREEREGNIKFSDFEQPVPRDQAIEEQWIAKAPLEAAAPEVVRPDFPGGQMPLVGPALTGTPETQAAETSTSAITYRRLLSRCWKCKDEMYLYTWDGHHPWQEDHPTEPVPESVQLRWSNMVNGKYWANVCLKCGSAQTDDSLFTESAANAWEKF